MVEKTPKDTSLAKGTCTDETTKPPTRSPATFCEHVPRVDVGTGDVIEEGRGESVGTRVVLHKHVDRNRKSLLSM